MAVKRKKRRTSASGYAASGAAGYVGGQFVYGAGVGIKVERTAKKKTVRATYKKLHSSPETKKYLKNNPGSKATALRKRLKAKARSTPTSRALAQKIANKTLKGRSFKRKALAAGIAGAVAGTSLYRRSKRKKSSKKTRR